jgi:arabinan endo-1,5-alpha-L-arabinosidase
MHHSKYGRISGRTWFGFIGLVVLGLVALAMTAALPANAAPVSSKSGHAVPLAGTTSGPIVAGVDSAECVDDYQNATVNGTVVDLWDCTGGANQDWTVESDGTIQVNGKCLDVTGAATANGTLIDLWACTGNANQQWTVESGTLVNPSSGKCLDDPASSTTEGTQLDLWACNGGSNQKWTINGASSGGGGTVLTSVPDNLGVHDPSRIIDDDGTYVFWGTGGGGYYSTDGKTWKSAPNLFPNGFPSEVTAVLPDNSGVWAPDLIYNPNSGVYDLYYAVALWGSNNYTLIGLLTSPSVDPTSSAYHWTDRGIVIEQTPTYGDFSAIDPAPFFDASGNMWLSFGSGYSYHPDTSLNIISLNKTTGLRSGTTDYVVGSGHAEATYVAYHDGYYYLFWNTGGCCSGASSTYEIHVARSTTVAGPYSASQIFLESSSTEHGPGQIGILDQNGTDYYSYHYYPNSGGSVLGYHVLTWASDGWPESS